MNLHEATQQLGLTTYTPDAVTNYLVTHPKLGEAVRASDKDTWLGGAVESLSRQVPIPPTCSAFLTGPFLRLPESVRCYYFSPTPLKNEAQEPVTKGVIALKGFEPLAGDFEALLSSRQLTPDHILERFALIEGKAPCTMTWQEAEKEAQAAAALQLRHLDAYGTLARLPLPLCTYRFSDELGRPIIEACRRHLSRKGFEVVRGSLEHGVGAYAYYYPSFPIRTQQYDYALPAGVWSKRKAVLDIAGGPEKVIERWAQGFVRVLYLGYLPATLASTETGNMCQPQNTVIDGGFVDVDSVHETSALPLDGYFYESLQLAVTSLFRSVLTLLAQHPSFDPIEPRVYAFRGNALHASILHYLLSCIRRAIETEARPGLSLDPRILEYFAPNCSFESLSRRLAAFRPERPIDHMRSVNLFLDLQRQLFERVS